MDKLGRRTEKLKCAECGEELEEKTCLSCRNAFEESDDIWCGEGGHCCSQECAASWNFTETEVVNEIEENV